MYETYWNFSKKPFDNAFDESLYYPSESHQGALLKLRYALEQKRGAALLAGAAGLGKTLLVHDLLRRLPEHFQPRANIVYPRLPAAELLASISIELTGERVPADLPLHDHVHRMARFLEQNARDDQHAVLVLDEAHLLDSREHLEMVRLLLNLATEGQPHLTVVLVGQPPLLTLVERMPALEERLAVKCLLRPLSPEETMSYVQHRLRAADVSDTIFDDSALQTVHQISQGVPRRINRICDLSLLIAFADERRHIDGDQVSAVSEELIVVSPE